MKVFVVDDDDMQREIFEELLKGYGCNVESFSSGEEALDALNEQYVDLVLTDYKMPGLDGIETLEKIKDINPEIQVLMVTGHGSIKSATKAMKLGAWDYITKPVEPADLKAKLDHIREHNTLTSENKLLREKLEETSPETEIVHKSEKMRKVLNLIGRVAESKSSVLIQGETGTGKELVAQTIHNLSGRQKENFVPVNCAAIPENLFESTIFGHEKGAFTGASKQQKGKFEIANKGTLFLDEIGEIPESFQVKLLRVLQDHKFHRLGSSQMIEADVRIVSATNQDIEELVEKGVFRKDLSYRLNVITIDIPPLRDRKEDIPALVEHFIEEYSDNNSGNVKEISSEALDRLLKYDFPGNVRELENIIERAILLSRNEIITTRELPFEDQSQNGDFEKKSLPQKIEEYEKMLINKALEKSEGVQVKAAEILGISESTLRYKLNKYFD